ncbi:MAG: ATPase [Gammaproteobacteria bacterium]|nr:ATPase [Gammaproteobacteria bacterium]
MGDSLKDLLEAEAQAEAIVAEGEQERDAIVQKALDDAREMEQQFRDRLPEMHQSFVDKAEKRAQQTIAEIKLRYDERNKVLRDQAGEHEQEVLERALALILEGAAGRP